MRINTTESEEARTVIICEDMETDQARPTLWNRLCALLHSWQFSITAWIVLTILVLLINISISILVGATSGFKDGLGEIVKGDCDSMQRWNTLAHLLINILSTLLLAGSNFCMQCLSAPTRSEIDHCHSRGRALEIGAPGFKNLKYVKRRKMIMWILFALTSVPLHLFYNSVVYYSIVYHGYYVVFATPSFLQPGNLNITSEIESSINSTGLPNLESRLGVYTAGHVDVKFLSKLESLRSDALNDHFVKLEPAECVRAYAKDYMSSYGNVILVPSSEQNVSLSIQYALDMKWICPGPKSEACQFDTEHIANDPSSFTPGDVHIDHCLVEEKEQECAFFFNLHVAIIVMIFNLTKGVLMVLVAFYIPFQPILTLGDAIKSFLSKPDPWTRGNCLYDRTNFRPEKFLWNVHPQEWTGSRARWYKTSNASSWCQFLVPWLIIIVPICCVEAFYIDAKINGTSKPDEIFDSAYQLFRLGLGNLKSSTVIDESQEVLGYDHSPISYIIIANIPQLLFSVLYFPYNAILTRMLGGLEWTQLPLKSRGLRVSKEPKGAQRHTYFLQLPYRYNVPLVIVSAGLHWLVSESFSVAALKQRSLDLTNNFVPTDSYSDIKYVWAWSPLAILLSIILSTLMLLVLIGLGMRRYPTGMPLGSNNSLVIAAACHIDSKKEDENITQEKLRWGVVSDFEGQPNAGHCAISNQQTELPKVGQKYA